MLNVHLLHLYAKCIQDQFHRCIRSMECEINEMNVVVCRYCAVLFSLLFASLCYFLIIWLTFFNILLCMLSCFLCLFSILCILCFFIVLCIVSPFVYSCLFPIFIQVYHPMPPGRNPLALSKYNIILCLFN